MDRFVLALSAAPLIMLCSCSSSDTTASDAGPIPVSDSGVSIDSGAPDAALPVPDAASPGPDAALPAGDYYELAPNRTTPQMVQCQAGGGGYIIAGSASDRTGLSFYFQAQPTAGTFTVEPLANAGPPPVLVPASAIGVIVRYSKDPNGGTNERHYAQSGTVTVTLENGKLRAAATGLPAKEITTAAAGVVAGQLTCP